MIVTKKDIFFSPITAAVVILAHEPTNGGHDTEDPLQDPDEGPHVMHSKAFAIEIQVKLKFHTTHKIPS